MIQYAFVPRGITLTLSSPHDPALLLPTRQQSLLNEARLCIADCVESKRVGDKGLEEETAQASEAVDDAFAAYLDMLEEFQGCDEELRKRFADVRDESTSQLKSLRNELDQILQEGSKV